MKRYPAYKDSGIEWSPRIPANWQARPVKARFDVQLGKMLQNDSESPSDRRVPYLKALHVTWGNVQIEDLPDMWASPTDIYQYGVKDGDLLVCEGGEVGRAGIVYDPPENCIIQNALHRVRPQVDSNIKFLLYVLYTVAGADWFSILCNKATIAHLTREKITALRIPIPSGEEQKKIADYLDCKTAQIDELIAKKERMIELLKEERTAIINQAVTKGLDPNVEMKDPGIEWLGKVPKHWEIKRLKYVASINPQRPDGIPDEAMIVFMAMESMNADGTYDNSIVRPYSEVKTGFTYFAEGDVIFAKITPCFENGKGALLRNLGTPVGFGSTEFHVLRAVKSKAIPEYLYFFTISGLFRELGKAFMQGVAGQKRVTNNFVQDFVIGVPPVDEQKAISSYLAGKINQIDTQIGRENKLIEYLKEYRTALISEVVTGKIDVRG